MWKNCFANTQSLNEFSTSENCFYCICCIHDIMGVCVFTCLINCADCRVNLINFCLFIVFVLQLCGSFADTMTRTVQAISENMQVDFIDVNIGCPIDLVVQKVCGMLIKNA
jgi:Dihydrouridine synthase (Dus)